jgi:hypothetical protein
MPDLEANQLRWQTMIAALLSAFCFLLLIVVVIRQNEIMRIRSVIIVDKEGRVLNDARINVVRETDLEEQKRKEP